MSSEEQQVRRDYVNKTRRQAKLRSEGKAIPKNLDITALPDADPPVSIMISQSTCNELRDLYYETMVKSNDENYSKTYDDYLLSLIEQVRSIKS